MSTIPPDFKVLINEVALTQVARKDMRAIMIHEDITAASMFTLELYNWDDETLQFTWSDDTLFAPGNEIEIWLGYVDATEKIMIGEVTSLEPSFQAGATSVIVRGYDHRHRLLRGRKTRSFTETKDSAIAEQIAKEAGLSVQATDTKVTLEYVLQRNQTDYDFLQYRAHRIGYELFVKDKVLYFRPRENDTSATITLVVEEDIIALYPRLTTVSQVAEVVVQGWDIHKKESIISKAAVGDESTMMGGNMSGPKAARNAFGQASLAYVDRPVFTKSEADQIATGQFNDVAMAYIQGDGVCYGRSDLKAGTTIEVQGAGKNFSGLYYVTSTKHTMGKRGYHTHFTYQRNAT